MKKGTPYEPISLSIEKLSGFLIKKLSEKVSAWRNLFPDRETCFRRKCAE